MASQAAAGAMRQMHSKNVGNRIELMKWSNRMDLMVCSNDKGIKLKLKSFQKAER